MIKSLGGKVAIAWCGDEFGYAPDVPVFSTSRNYCKYSGSSRPASSFNCMQLPTPENHNKQRICWCHKAGYLYLFVHNIILVILL
jgi:hypothetical protein